MTSRQAIIKAAAVLGKASEKLLHTGWRDLHIECDNAIKDLLEAETVEFYYSVDGKVKTIRI